MNTSAIAMLLVVVLTVLQGLLASPVKNDIQSEYTTEDCPPGIWVCKKKRDEVAQPAVESDDCPPGIWTCKKKRENIVKPEDVSINNDDCPPGIWTCKKKRAVNRTVKRLKMLKRWMREKAEKEAQRMLNAVAKQAKRNNDCPPGIWVC